MQYIIVHGSFGNSKENWLPWLEKKLVKDGHSVINIDYPVEDWQEMEATGHGAFVVRKQTLHHWTEHFRGTAMPRIDTQQPVVFVGHSLAPLFILHLLQTFDLKVALGIFVAPFFSELPDSDWKIDAVNFSFYDTALDFKEVRQQLPHSVVLYSDNDPYVAAEQSTDFAEKVQAAAIQVKAAGHFNTDSGWTRAPLVYELCQTVVDSTQ